MSSPPPPPDVQAMLDMLATLYGQFIVTKEAQVSATCLILYDWILTLDREVKYFWPLRRITIPQALYLASRYMPITSQIVNLVAQFLPRPSFHVSDYWLLNWNIGTKTAEIIIVEIILTYRIWAVYGRSRMVLMLLGSLLFICSAATITLLVISVAPTHTGNEPIPGIFLCFIATSPRFLWGFWIPVFVFESVAFGCMCYKAYFRYREHQSLGTIGGKTFSGTKLMDVLFYDSFTYFATVGVLFTLMTFLFRFATGTIYLTAEGWVFSLISILSCRMLLNLRTTGDEDLTSTDHELSTLSGLKFRVPTTGPGKDTYGSIGGTFGTFGTVGTTGMTVDESLGVDASVGTRTHTSARDTDVDGDVDTAEEMDHEEEYSSDMRLSASTSGTRRGESPGGLEEMTFAPPPPQVAPPKGGSLA
ncbi:hypothetical protein SISNIDRAFT_552437 [Sistotremastrum niveocremeum HHB9708]|uniref:DUF6533 domain-containing protein n=1 Tax=Sistotremastrum niveocremeum HHB9708 TaxID=1314777 RepID=A0A164PLA6_9AGAM|nr:hypothetical protein SISNIDRAFT_552437 [Sistotremastrum niveocremeum HHB9708]